MDLEARSSAMQPILEQHLAAQTTLNARISALEARNDALESRNAALEARSSLAEKELTALRAQVAALENVGDATQRAEGVTADTQKPLPVRSYNLAPRGLTVERLPGEIIALIVTQVADKFGHIPFSRLNAEDLTTNSFIDYEASNLKSLRSLAIASRLMHQHVVPTLWSCFTVRGPRNLSALAIAVLQNRYGPYIRSLTWDWDWKNFEFRFDFITNIWRAMRCVGASIGPVSLLSSGPNLRMVTVTDGHLEDSDLVPAAHLLQDSSNFAVQVLKEILLRTFNLEVFSSTPQTLAMLRDSDNNAATIRRLSLTNLKELQLCFDLSSPSPMRHADLMALAQDTLGFVMKLRAVHVSGQYPRIIPRQSTMATRWSSISTLSVMFTSLTDDSSADRAGVIRTWQNLFDCTPSLSSFAVTLVSSRSFGPEDIFPEVVFPPALVTMSITFGNSTFASSIHSICHVRQLRYLRCHILRRGQSNNISPDQLPPYLTTLKLVVSSSSIIDTLYSSTFLLANLGHKLAQGQYPDSLAHICYDDRDTVNSRTDQQCLSAVLSPNDDDTVGAMARDCRLIAAVLRLYEICREQGVTLCGPRVEDQIITAETFDNLPERIKTSVIAELEAMRAPTSSDAQ